MADTAQKKGSKKKKKSKVSGIEWYLVIGLLGLTDLVQIALNFAGIPYLVSVGIVANRFIDIVVFMAWMSFLYMKDILTFDKVIAAVGAFLAEEIPDADSLPFWFLDGLYTMARTKAEELIEEETGIAVNLERTKASEGGKNATSAETSESTADNGTAEGEEKESTEGDESEDKNEEKENETGEEGEEEEEDGEKKKEEEDKKKSGDDSEKKPGNRGGKEGAGGKRGREEENAAQAGSNPLNLRGKSDERQSEKESARSRSNLLDLSLSYGERKKQREEEEENETESTKKPDIPPIVG